MSRATSVAGIAEGLVDIVRTAARAKARRQQDAPAAEVEWAAHFLLRALQANGPMRLSELAETVHADLSTISRQSATLVKRGLLERRADPDDGRASVLVPTAAGDDFAAERQQLRVGFFDAMLSDWSAADLETFARLFDRFSGDYRRVTAAWMNGQPEPVAAAVR